LGGQFQRAGGSQPGWSRLLSVVSLVLMLAVLCIPATNQPSWLTLMIMANIPLALVGAVLGLWLAGQPLSVAALIGFITLAGISVRNGILKVSHYMNLMRLRGERFDHAMLTCAARWSA
jgi:HME family heavy-metal exporter